MKVSICSNCGKEVKIIRGIDGSIYICEWCGYVGLEVDSIDDEE